MQAGVSISYSELKVNTRCWTTTIIVESCSCSSSLGPSVAAIARRNRISVRASFRVAKERADALVEFGADDVLEPAGLGVGLGVVDGKSIFEEAFSKSMPAHDAPRPLAADWRKLRLAGLQFDQMPFAHAAQSS